METSTMKFGDKIGRGAYGIVYSGVDESDQTKIAVKRNIVDTETFGIVSLKETDVLTRLAGYPYIVCVKHVLFGNSSEIKFPKENISRMFSPGMKDDRVHFIFDREATSLHNVTKRKKLDSKVVKIVSAQLLLAAEWMHSRGIVHRDIKPANILYNSSIASPHIRLCDFGLCGMLGGTGVSTPGLVTSWYRPPEICLSADSYSGKIDIWSIGAVLFELLSGTALLYGRNDSSQEILAGIFSRLPAIASKSTVERMAGSEMQTNDLKAVFSKLSRKAKGFVLDESMTIADRIERTKTNVREAAGLSAAEVQAFNDEEGGNLADFCDLVGWMLSFDPENRPTATQALEHRFFGWVRDFIEETRQEYPPTGPTLPVIDFAFGEERTTAYILLIACYNARVRIPWYDHRVIFHAADIFDRYLIHKRSSSAAAKAAVAVADDRTTYLRVYVCLYIFHKYFLTLEEPDGWKEFAPTGFSDRGTVKEAEEFEMYLVKDVCECNIYRDTLFEVVAYNDGRVRETSVRKCLSVLSRLSPKDWNNESGSSVRALYRDVVVKDG